jgi:hypothetical protein
MPLGNNYPVKCSIPDTVEVAGVWTGAGAANMTKTSGDWSKGIASVNYAAATGKFTITFTDVGYQIIGAEVTVMRPDGTAPLVGNIVRGSFSQSAKTVPVQFWDMATPSLANPAATDRVCIRVKFAKQSQLQG